MSETYYVTTKNEQEPLNIEWVEVVPEDVNVEFSKDVKTGTLYFGEYSISFRILGNSSPGLKYIDWGDLSQSVDDYYGSI